MPALLLWLGQFLLRTVASEIFKKAAIFLTLNICMTFFLGMIAKNNFGFNIFGLGDTIGGLINGLNAPMIMYVLVNSGFLAAIFLVLNAALVRFGWRTFLRFLGR